MSVSLIAREILNYLANNQEASDNLEGITHWWLLKQSVYRNVKDVREALGELLELGYLTRGGEIPALRDGLDPTDEDELLHYQINIKMLQEIQALLKHDE